jgi:hypothetical protein
MLGLWVLLVKIRVDGAPFYIGDFCPSRGWKGLRSTLSINEFKFAQIRDLIKKGEDLLCHPKRVRCELGMGVDPS